jgi:hypothetical protein
VLDSAGILCLIKRCRRGVGYDSDLGRSEFEVGSQDMSKSFVVNHFKNGHLDIT